MSSKNTFMIVICWITCVALLVVAPVFGQTGVTISEDGKVGIGTSTPEYDLHIKETASAGATEIMTVLENDGGVRLDMIDSNNNATWVLQNRFGMFAITKAGTGVRELEVDGLGNLVVTGDITSGGTTHVPDYVFEPDYRLMPIGELAAFIEAERHLPGVPSQAEVLEQGGVNLSQMQMHLLEKIEELTLYTLAQQEQIRELEHRLNEMNEE